MKKTEFFITSILFVLFGFFIFPWDQAPPGYFYYAITILAGMGGLFCFSRFYLFPHLQKKNIIFPLSILIPSLLVSYCIPAYLWITLDFENRPPLYEPLILKETLSYLLLAIAAGGIYHLLKRPKLVKKILVYTSIFLLLGGTIFFTKYLIDIGYEGNESIRFLESDFKNIQEVINHEELKGKALFVDMWYSSCRPCRVEFNALKELKESLKNEDFEFLYLARETSHPNSFQLWKNAVKKLDLSGWHVYMSPELEASLVNAIKDNTKEGLKGYPHFLLVNKDGEIVSYNAPLPSQKEKFLSEINKVSN